MAIDPVCGMLVDEKTARHKTARNGKEFYFCSEAHKKDFDEHPGKRFAFENSK